MEIKRHRPAVDGQQPLAETQRFAPANREQETPRRRQEAPRQRQEAPRQRQDDYPLIGSSCRDCINYFYGVSLSRSDCKYEMRKDGHRRQGRCSYCDKIRPIVEGLTLTGKVKTIRKRIPHV